jgi:hypothetical protein
MFTLIIISFIMGTPNHGTSGTGTSIDNVQFTSEQSCQAAASTLTSDGQIGSDPYALTKVTAKCVRTDQHK